MYETETAMVSVNRTEEPETAPMVECLEFSVNIQTIKAFVNELSVLADECKIKVDPIDGLSVRLVDPAHIAMIDTGMAIELFDAWSIRPSNAYVGEFGIDLEKLQKYLKAFKAKDRDEILRVKVDMEKHRMTIEGPTGSRDLSLIDTTGMSDPKIPNLDLPTEIAIKDAKLFKGALKMASEISAHIRLRFNASESTLWIECENDMDKMSSKLEVEVIKSEYSTIYRTVNGIRERIETQNSQSLFPLEYLADMTKDLPNGFKLCLGCDYPLRVSHGKTVKLLAPRIESDD